MDNSLSVVRPPTRYSITLGNYQRFAILLSHTNGVNLSCNFAKPCRGNHNRNVRRAENKIVVGSVGECRSCGG